jgi:DNA polymerase-3 subunit gamma/tau
LCTTDPEKILETVLSRCTKFNLKSPNQETLAKFLTDVAKKENQKIDKDAIQLVALTGDGSYRDSLSNLQKVFSFTDEKYTEEFVSKILGVPQISAIFTYLKSLDGIIDSKGGVEVLQKLEDSGVDYLLFAKEVTYFARIVLLARHKLISESEIKENYGEHILEFVREFSTPANPDAKAGTQRINSLTLSKIIEAEIISKNSSLPFLSYELLLIN